MIRTACALTILALTAAPVTAQPRYSVSVIGGAPPIAPSGPVSQPLALNSTGRVVGYSYVSSGGIRALDWQSGALTNLSGLALFSNTFANRVNINDHIAGSGQVLGPGGTLLETHALEWIGGMMAEVDGLGGSHAAALAINDSDQIVGYATLPGDAQVRAFIHQNGVTTALNTFPGTTESYAYDISNSGFVVGSCVAGSPARPFRWFAGVASSLPIPAASRTGTANAVNEAGTAVGTWEVNQYTGSFAACIWDNGQRSDLPCLGGSLAYAVAADINNAGQVVGTSNSAAGFTGFLYQNGHMYNLRDLLVSALPITSANAINDRGQIAAVALIGGRETAVLLTPMSQRLQTLVGIAAPR